MGCVICPEGVSAQHWVGVLDGMVKVDTVSGDGRGTTLIGVSSGGWLGEGALLKHETRPYEVIALRDSWIALMPAATFDWLFDTSLEFNHFLVRQLNARLGQFVAIVESYRIQTTTAQVAVCVAELFNPSLCSVSSDELRISQGEIARLCGLSRQVASRALHELEHAGFLQMQYGAIRVLNLPGLHAYGRGLAHIEEQVPRLASNGTGKETRAITHPESAELLGTAAGQISFRGTRSRPQIMSS